jgi:hypothetical protein
MLALSSCRSQSEFTFSSGATTTSEEPRASEVRAGLLSWPVVTSSAGRSRKAPARTPSGAKASSSVTGLGRLGVGPAMPAFAPSGPPPRAAAGFLPDAAAVGLPAGTLPDGTAAPLRLRRDARTGPGRCRRRQTRRPGAGRVLCRFHAGLRLRPQDVSRNISGSARTRSGRPAILAVLDSANSHRCRPADPPAHPSDLPGPARGRRSGPRAKRPRLPPEQDETSEGAASSI